MCSTKGHTLSIDGNTFRTMQNNKQIHDINGRFLVQQQHTLYEVPLLVRGPGWGLIG